MYTLIICNSDGSLGRHEHQTLQDIEIKLNNALYEYAWHGHYLAYQGVTSCGLEPTM
jgi:hypothetical protein